MANIASRKYSDIDDAVTVYMVKKPLDMVNKAMNIAILGGDQTKIPQNSGKSISFRRYRLLDAVTTPIGEGTSNIGAVADNYMDFGADDMTADLAEYGSWTTLTDTAELLTTNDDFNGVLEAMGKQIGHTLEVVNYNVLKTCPLQAYAGSASSIGTVTSKISKTDLQRVVRKLDGNDAEKIRKILSSSANMDTKNISASYVALANTTLKQDFEAIQGWTPVHQYGSISGMINDNEIGQVADVRVVTSNLYAPYVGVGATYAGTDLEKDVNGKVNVYPVVIMGKGAFNTIGLKGMDSLTVKVKNPEVSPVTPYGNLYVLSWRTFHAICLTGPQFIVTLNVAKSVI